MNEQLCENLEDSPEVTTVGEMIEAFQSQELLLFNLYTL